MGELAKSGVPSISSVLPPATNKISGLLAGEAIAAGDACYIKSDGLVWLSTGAAATAPAEVDGFAAAASAAGEAVTLVFDLSIRYGAGLTPGTYYYLSGSVPGGLATTASTGGLVPIARAIDATRIHVMRSYPAPGSITAELTTLAGNIPTAAVPDIAATTDITTVPASFADLPAVRTYLVGANMVPNIEARLDGVEAKVNDLLAKLRTAGIVTP